MRNQERAQEIASRLSFDCMIPTNLNINTLPPQDCESQSPKLNKGMTMHSVHLKAHCQNESLGEKSENPCHNVDSELEQHHCSEVSIYIYMIERIPTPVSVYEYKQEYHRNTVPGTMHYVYAGVHVFRVCRTVGVFRVSRVHIVHGLQLLTVAYRIRSSNTENRVCTRPQVFV